MPELQRTNIIELIGKDSRRYHSAILTCYAFDFLFFEERLLPQLRSAGVKNMQVIADSDYIGHQLERTTGKEFRINKTYTLTTATAINGIFHPKILLLTGLRNGLLLIGSGNLTSSGMSGNDEVWAAFQYAGPDCIHAQLFKQAWEYLSTVVRQFGRGFAMQSYQWMSQQSAWLQDLPPITQPWAALNDGTTACWLSSNRTTSIYKQLFDLLPREAPEDIVMISPFYEAEGNFLKQLEADYQPGQLKCMIEPEFGTTPYLLPEAKTVSFFHWKDCLEDAGRLHAKLIRFRYKNEHYLVLGSANATLAAWGSPNTPAKNEEAVVVLRTKKTKDLLADLAIHLPGSTLKLKKAPPTHVSTTITTGHEFHLTYAELRGALLSCFLKETLSHELSLKSFDADGLGLETLTINADSNQFQTELTLRDALFKVALFKGKQRVSNYMVIHRVDILIKTNPDPRLERLDELFENMREGTAFLSTLADHFSIGWIDETPEQYNRQSQSHGNRQIIAKTDEQHYRQLSAEEFHNFDAYEQRLLESTEVRVADFLSMLTSELNLQSRENFEDSEETGQLLNDALPEGSGGVIEGRQQQRTGTQKEQKALMRFFHKLEDFYADELNDLYQNPSSVVNSQQVSIRALSQFHVAIDLYLYYLGRQYAPDVPNGEAEWQDFMPHGTLYDKGNARWFLADILGKFLLLCIPGFSTYTSELMTGKMRDFRVAVFNHALFATLNVNWGQGGTIYRDTLLLNICQFLGDEEFDKITATAAHKMIAGVAERYNYKAASFEINKTFFITQLLPAWQRWNQIYQNDKPSLSKPLPDIYTEQYIFRQKTGFAAIASKKKSANGQFEIALYGAGYPWNDQAEYNQLTNISTGSKLLCFKI
jgi:hypothetical protein